MVCLKKSLLFLCISSIGALFLLHPDIVSAAVQQGLHICATAIIPSLFPFFVLTNLWSELGYDQIIGKKLEHPLERIFHLPGQIAPALILGCCSGFPTGAYTLIHAYRAGKIAKQEAEQALTFCSNAGPAFVLGLIGPKVLNSDCAALCLWVIHIISALFIGVLSRPEDKRHIALKKREAIQINQGISASFTKAVKRAGAATFNICQYIIFFCVISNLAVALLPSWLHSKPFFIALLGGLELTNGILMLKSSSLDFAFILSAGLLGWNGLCIHCQVISEAADTGLSLKKYFFSKLMHGLLSMAIAAMCLPLFSFFSQNTFSSTNRTGIVLFALPFIILSIMIVKTSSGNRTSNRI